MTMPTGKYKPRLGSKAKKAAEIVKDRVAQGEPLTEALLSSATDEAYSLGGNKKKISIYLGQNLRRVAFLKELELDSSQVKMTLNEVLLQCLLGCHPIFPKDKQLMQTAMKLVARTAHAEKVEHHINEGEFAGRSTAELEYYGTHGEWPDTPVQPNASQRPQ